MDAPVTHRKETNNELARLCCLSFLLIGLLVSILAYLIFNIVFLIQDYDVSNECKGSNLWEYVLVSTILMFPSSSVKNDNFNLFVIIALVIGVLNLCMCIWGGIELWEYSCDDLTETNLWKVGLASFILQLTIAFLCILVMPFVACYMLVKEVDNEKPNPLNLKITTDV